MAVGVLTRAHVLESLSVMQLARKVDVVRHGGHRCIFVPLLCSALLREARANVMLTRCACRLEPMLRTFIISMR